MDNSWKLLAQAERKGVFMIIISFISEAWISLDADICSCKCIYPPGPILIGPGEGPARNK